MYNGGGGNRRAPNRSNGYRDSDDLRSRIGGNANKLKISAVCVELLKAIKSADLAIIIDMLALETETNKESMAAQFMKEIDKGHFDFIEDVFKEIKVDDLRSALGALGLSENGTREKLMERLRRNMETVDEASSNFQQNSTANRPPVVTTADPLPVSQPTVATPPKFKSLQLDSIKVQGVNPADAEDFKNRFSVVSELDSFWIDEREMTAYMIFKDPKYSAIYLDQIKENEYPPGSGIKLEAVLMSRANMLDECQHAQSMVSSYGSVVPPPIPNNPSVAAPPEVPVLINMPDTVLVKGTKLGDSARKLFEAFGSVKYFDMDPSRQAAIAVYSTSEEAAIAHPEISIRLNSGNHEGGLQVELLIATQALQEMELIKERNSLPDMRDPYLMEDDSQTRRPLSRSRERSGSKSDRRKYSVGDSSTSQRQSGKSPTANDDGMNTHKDHAKYRGDENAKNGLEITGIVGSVKPKDCRNYMEENYGPVHFLWMTRLKKFTYVIFDNADDAERAQKDLDGLRWPSEGKRLKVTLLSHRDCVIRQTERELDEKQLGGPKVPYDAIKSRINRDKDEKLREKKKQDAMTKNYMHVPEGSSSRDPHRPVIPEVITPARAAPPQIPSTHVPAPTSVATPPADDSAVSVEKLIRLYNDECNEVMFSNILKRIGKSGTNMSRGALVDLMESIWRDALSKLQPVASASVISPAHSVVADGLPDRKRTSSASPEDDKISTTSSKRFRLNRQSMADPEVVIVVTKILHIRNLDPKMENDAIIHEFRQFGIIPTFWRSFCLNFCYMEFETESQAMHAMNRMNEQYFPDDSHYKLLMTYEKFEAVVQATKKAEEEERQRKQDEHILKQEKERQERERQLALEREEESRQEEIQRKERERQEAEEELERQKVEEEQERLKAIRKEELERHRAEEEQERQEAIRKEEAAAEEQRRLQSLEEDIRQRQESEEIGRRKSTNRYSDYHENVNGMRRDSSREYRRSESREDFSSRDRLPYSTAKRRPRSRSRSSSPTKQYHHRDFNYRKREKYDSSSRERKESPTRYRSDYSSPERDIESSRASKGAATSPSVRNGGSPAKIYERNTDEMNDFSRARQNSTDSVMDTQDEVTDTKDAGLPKMQPFRVVDPRIARKLSKAALQTDNSSVAEQATATYIPPLQAVPKHTVFVSEFPFQVTMDRYDDLFGRCGDIVASGSNAHRTVYYIEYASETQALRAQKALNGRIFEGFDSGPLRAVLTDTEDAKEKLVEIKRAEMDAIKASTESQMADDGQPDAGLPSDERFVLITSMKSFSPSPTPLREALAKQGNLLRLFKFKTGHKTYNFVAEFSARMEAAKARMALDGSTTGAAQIHVEIQNLSQAQAMEAKHQCATVYKNPFNGSAPAPSTAAS